MYTVYEHGAALERVMVIEVENGRRRRRPYTHIARSDFSACCRSLRRLTPRRRVVRTAIVYTTHYRLVYTTRARIDCRPKRTRRAVSKAARLARTDLPRENRLPKSPTPESGVYEKSARAFGDTARFLFFFPAQNTTRFMSFKFLHHVPSCSIRACSAINAVSLCEDDDPSIDL